MPIGRFARAVRLSVKALRHYDEEGLLRPGYVDPRTGYRYYGREQARDALMIAMLRSLELPLETVRAALAATPAELSALVARERARLAGVLARRRSALRALERIAGAGKLAPYEIAVRQEPAQLVARLTNATTAEDLVVDSTGWVFEVMAEVERAGRALAMPILCINEAPDRDGRITVHACAALAPPAPARLGRARAVELPAAPCAFTIHRGSYEELGLAHHALFAWAQERGHETSGEIREIYVNDPNAVAEDELVTEVLLPIPA
jgi:DNA-binding transcriptional MerR regulator